MKNIYQLFLFITIYSHIQLFLFSQTSSEDIHIEETKFSAGLRVNSLRPVGFIENKGQWPEDVLFLFRIKNMDAWITNKGILFNFYKVEADFEKLFHPDHLVRFEENEKAMINGHRVYMRFKNSNNPSRLITKEKYITYYNYFKGNDPRKFATNVGIYNEIVLENIYNGIDLRLYSQQGLLRYDFIVNPGADPSSITLNFDGAENVFQINNELRINSSLGEISMGDLKAFQDNNQDINIQYSNHNNDWKFNLGSYDKNQTLIIDPLIFSTMLGGTGYDGFFGLAVDNSGNAYAGGYTQSSDYDVTTGAYQTLKNSQNDCVVSKVNSTGNILLFSTYIGGNSNDEFGGLAIDGSNNVYITGYTRSTNYPTTAGAFQTSLASPGTYDVFVTKFNATGTALLYSTYIGGTSDDMGLGIAVDNSNSAYVCGYTSSNDYDITPGVYQPTKSTAFTYESDAFVTKLNASGTGLSYSTYIGGSTGGGSEQANAIAVDNSGNAYICGRTTSTNYDVTAGCYQSTMQGPDDVFVTKFNSTGTSLLYSTYLGGSSVTGDWIYDIAVDNSGFAYVCGATYSNDFDITPGAFQTFFSGAPEGYVTKINTTGTALVYSTFLGGFHFDYCNGIHVDASGNAYITGSTKAASVLPITFGYPLTPGAYQTTLEGDQDAFVTILNAAGNNLLYSTLLGGNNPPGNNESGYKVRFSSVNNSIYVVGHSASVNFDVTPGTVQPFFQGGSADGFITRICPIRLWLTSATGTDAQTICTGNSLTTITYSTYNVTSLTVSGLPGGVTWSFSGGNLTISGTPTATGTFTYTISYTGNCGTFTRTGTITVNPNNTITLTSPPNSNLQTVCLNSPIQNITYSSTGATGATFSGLPAGVTGSFSSGSITISGTPTSVSSSNYTVTLTGGCGNVTATGTINVVDPNIAINASPSSTICVGNSVTLNVTGGGTAWSWSSGGTTSSETVSPGSSTTYTVTVTDPSACSGTATASIPVTVVASPGVSVSASPSSTICVGNSVTLNATGGGTAWSWSSGGTSSSETVSPGSSTTYTVTVTNPSACSGTATASIPVTVVTDPGISVNASPSSTICVGNSVTLNVTGGGTAWSWSSGETTSNITVSPGNSATYTVTVTDPTACSGTATASIPVTVVTDPGLTIGAAPSTTICAGSSTTLSVNGGGTSYSWSTGETNSSITVGPTATTTYTVTVTDPTACSGTATASVTVNVVDMSLAANVTYSPAQTVCLGNDVIIGITGGDAGTSYAWNTGETTDQITVTPANGTQVYTVTITNPVACSGSFIMSIPVGGVDPGNSVGISAADSTLCPNQSTTLFVLGGGTGSTYVWSDSNLSGPNPTINPTSTTTYTVTVTDPQACVGTVTASITVNVSGVAINIVSNPEMAVVCMGTTHSITTNVTGGQSPFSYNWITVPFGYTGSVTNDNIQLTDIGLSQGGSYVVQVTDNGGCTATAMSTVIVSEGPAAYVNSPVCVGETLEFYAVGGTSYQWAGPNGFTSTSQAPSITNVALSASGTYTVTITGGACSGTVSLPVVINNTGNPEAAITAYPGVSVCSTDNTVILVANLGGDYLWNTGATTQAITVQPTVITTYTVTILDAGGCAGTATASITVQAGLPISVSIQSNSDVICPNTPATLIATATPNLGTAAYLWSNGETTQSINVTLGGIYQVTVTQQGCLDTAAVVITSFDPLTQSPVAGNDIDSTQINTSVEIMYGNNDANAGGFATIITPPQHGTATVNSMKIDYTPSLNYSGWDSLQYVICSSICSNVCDTAWVRIYVQPKVQLVIPGGISPNNDGYNDGWVIGGLDAYPDHRVVILNRWGDVVFEASPYNNDWVGQSNTGLKLGGDKLPRGTYYYVIYLGEGEEVLKGFVELTY